MKKQILNIILLISCYLLLFISYIISQITYTASSISNIDITIPNSYSSSAMFLDSNIALVNTNHYLDKTYIPCDLESLNKYDFHFARENEEYYLKKECLVNLLRMVKDMEKLNLHPVIFSTYRSYEKQLLLKANSFSLEVAKEGHSEHQLGLAVDISTLEFGLTNMFDTTLEYKWLYDNSYKYGFILRYLPKFLDVTGYSYEPWHFRYVSTNHSMAIKTDISFEEYLKMNY